MDDYDLNQLNAAVSETADGAADLASVFAEMGSAFAADCGSRRFDLPGLPGQFIEVQVLDGSAEDRLFQAGIQFTGIPGEQGSSLKINMEGVYVLACELAVTDYRFVTKAGEEVRPSARLEAKRDVFRKLHPKMKAWVKDCIAALNPNVSWAGMQMVQKKTP